MQRSDEKVVLLSSSPFFLNLLKRNKHPHPLVYMRGLKYENLLSMVDFFYRGEANVYQENLDTFLVMADELQLKGLNKREEEEVETTPKNVSNRQKSQGFNTTNNPNATYEEKTIQGKTAMSKNRFATLSPKTETAKALDNFSTDLVELDQEVKSMMTKSENIINKKNERAKLCKVCGKEGQMYAITNHIEANHLTGISIPCNACDKNFHTRHALKMHNRTFHSQFKVLSQ